MDRKRPGPWCSQPVRVVALMAGPDLGGCASGEVGSRGQVAPSVPRLPIRE